MGHTCGEWRIIKGQHRVGGTDEYEPFHYVTGEVPVCDINSFDDDETEDANAAIICAAPIAIAALKAFAAVDDFSGWHPKYAQAIELARAAIAKATNTPAT
jgi:hypothetical protein